MDSKTNWCDGGWRLTWSLRGQDFGYHPGSCQVRGTGIAERTHEYVATKMKEGKAIIALCGDTFAGFTYIESWGNKQYVVYFRSDRSSRFPWIRTGKNALKQASFPTGTSPMAESKNIQSDLRSRCHENEHRTGLCACHLQRTDRRRSFLERMRRMYQPWYSGSEKPQVLHLHSHAVRSDRAAEHQKRTRKK